VVVDAKGNPLLIDFGLSKASRQEQTSSDLQGKGSTRWSAPELLKNEASKSEVTDVYAFAITIAEVCF
jgi:serine/threonine protein kinase